jgi:hypothetical protein
MMVSKTKIYLIGLWAVALLGSTAGVSIHQVYCYCVGETTVSLFEAEDACHMEDVAALADNCCKRPEKPVEKSCCEKPAEKNDGCTKKTTTVVKLKAEYEVSHHDFKKLDVGKYFLEAAVFPFPPIWAPKVSKTASSHFDRPPPPVSGRMKCVRQGVFRC